MTSESERIFNAVSNVADQIASLTKRAETAEGEVARLTEGEKMLNGLIATLRQEAVELVTELSIDLATEVEARATGELPRRIKRDLEPVGRAVAFLSKWSAKP